MMDEKAMDSIKKRTTISIIVLALGITYWNAQSAHAGFEAIAALNVANRAQWSQSIVNQQDVVDSVGPRLGGEYSAAATSHSQTDNAQKNLDAMTAQWHAEIGSSQGLKDQMDTYSYSDKVDALRASSSALYNTYNDDLATYKAAKALIVKLKRDGPLQIAWSGGSRAINLEVGILVATVVLLLMVPPYLERKMPN